MDLLYARVDSLLFWVMLGRSTASNMDTLGRATYPERPTWNLAPGSNLVHPFLLLSSFQM